MSHRPCRIRTLLVMGAAALGCVASCTAKAGPDASDVSTSRLTPPAPTTAEAPPSGPTTSSPGPSDPVIGPPAVRVLSLKADGAGTRIKIVGPTATTYRLRTNRGLVVSCSQTAGSVDSHALPGLPPNAVQHVSLRCSTAFARATHGSVLAEADLGDFNYKFTVPIGF